ncbi:MAG: hypothetical protein ACREUY_04725, partial [Burkholderiales bacterium]
QPGNLGFLHDDFPISAGLWSPPTSLVSLLALLTLLFAAWWLRTVNAIAAFGIFLFFAAHLLESSFFPLELMYEHRNYLALYGIILTVCSMAGQFAGRFLTTILVVAAVASIVFVTVPYVDLWSSHQKMFAQIARVHPSSLRLRITLASDFAEAGKFDEAKDALSGLVGPGFDLQRAYISCRQYGQLPATELKQIVFHGGSKITTYEMQGLIELANLGLDDHCAFPPEEYLRIADGALSAHVINDRSVQSLWIYKAHYLHKIGKFEAALAALDAAFQAYNSNPTPLFLATEWLVQAKDKMRAEKYFARAQASAGKSRQDFSAAIDRIRTNIRNL